MAFKMKYKGFPQKEEYPGADPITGGNNPTYEKKAGENMQAAKNKANELGVLPGDPRYIELMNQAREKNAILADSLRSATPQKKDEDVNTLLPSEYDGTWVFEGDENLDEDFNIHEKITDLDDRIDFIREDQFSGVGDKEQQDKDIAKLREWKGKLKSLWNFKPGDVD